MKMRPCVSGDKNRKFGGQLNAERIALLAMYHDDASEVLTDVCRRR